MKYSTWYQNRVGLLLVVIMTACNPGKQKESKNIVSASDNTGYGLTPIPFNEMTLEDKFWKPRLETQVATWCHSPWTKPFQLWKTGRKPGSPWMEILRIFLFPIASSPPIYTR